jgi:hypothetical protein
VGQGRGKSSGPTGRRQQAEFSIFLDQVVDQEGRQHWETRLYHAESGAESVLPGALPEGWIAWIFERIGSRAAAGAGAGPSRAVLQVEGVEILDVAVQEEEDRAESVHTITAQVVVRLTGVARVERELGSEVLRGIARSTPRSGRGRSPAA